MNKIGFGHFDGADNVLVIGGMSVGAFLARKFDVESLFTSNAIVVGEKVFPESKLSKIIKDGAFKLVSCQKFQMYNGCRENKLYMNGSCAFVTEQDFGKKKETDAFNIKLAYSNTEKGLKQFISQINSLTEEKETTPSINILSKEFGELAVRNAKTEEWEDIIIDNCYYNADFVAFHKKMNGFIKKRNNNSLCLLHGATGTGKTTFLRRYMADNKDESYLYVPSAMVKHLSDPSFLDFLVSRKNNILILEDAEKSIKKRGSRDSDENAVSNLLQMTDGIMNDILKLKVIVTFNCEIDEIDEALVRNGRLYTSYEFKNLTEKRAIALAKKIGKDYTQIKGETSLADVFAIGEMNEFEKKSRKLGFKVK